MDAALVLSLVERERQLQPRLGGRKVLSLISAELEEYDAAIGRDRFFSLLRAQDLLVPRKRGRVRTTHSRHSLPVSGSLPVQQPPSPSFSGLRHPGRCPQEGRGMNSCPLVAGVASLRPRPSGPPLRGRAPLRDAGPQGHAQRVPVSQVRTSVPRKIGESRNLVSNGSQDLTDGVPPLSLSFGRACAGAHRGEARPPFEPERERRLEPHPWCCRCSGRYAGVTGQTLPR